VGIELFCHTWWQVENAEVRKLKYENESTKTEVRKRKYRSEKKSRLSVFSVLLTHDCASSQRVTVSKRSESCMSTDTSDSCEH